MQLFRIIGRPINSLNCLASSTHSSGSTTKNYNNEFVTAFEDPYRWKKNLALAVNKEESIEQGTLIPRIDLRHIGSASLLGRQEHNEDRLLIYQLSPELLLLGMFDGHGGVAAAEFARSFLPECLRFQVAELQTAVLKRNTSLRNIPIADLEKALISVFFKVNNLMARHFYYYGKTRDRHWSGTTATVVILRYSHQLVVAHVGDSRALISKSGGIEALTVDHSPGDIDVSTYGELRMTETDRILDCGGAVVANSLGVLVVNGRLGMTRSLGDSELKPFGVIARPCVTSKKINHSSTSFLVMVSDGVTHVMSDEEIFTLVTSCRTPAEAARQLVENALLYGSEDNASAIVVPFGSWGKFSDPDGGQTVSFQPLHIAYG